jgi:hypothetical protein
MLAKSPPTLACISGRETRHVEANLADFSCFSCPFRALTYGTMAKNSLAFLRGKSQ